MSVWFHSNAAADEGNWWQGTIVDVLTLGGLVQIAKYKICYKAQYGSKMKLCDFEPLGKDSKWELVTKNYKPSKE